MRGASPVRRRYSSFDRPETAPAQSEKEIPSGTDAADLTSRGLLSTDASAASITDTAPKYNQRRRHTTLELNTDSKSTKDPNRPLSNSEVKKFVGEEARGSFFELFKTISKEQPSLLQPCYAVPTKPKSEKVPTKPKSEHPSRPAYRRCPCVLLISPLFVSLLSSHLPPALPPAPHVMSLERSPLILSRHGDREEGSPPSHTHPPTSSFPTRLKTNTSYITLFLQVFPIIRPYISSHCTQRQRCHCDSKTRTESRHEIEKIWEEK
jgi:hypothetical protein